MGIFKRKFNPEKELNKIQNGNKKKTLIGIISLLVIIAIGSSFALYQVRNVQDIVYTKVGAWDDVVISSTVDGSSSYVTRSDGGHNATVSCTSPGSATWDYKSWGIEISSFASKKTNCFINYTTNSNKTYLNDKVTSLVGNGQVFNENGIRYEGMNPNNYVWFNNELWRIIGVFDDTTHGVTGESLVKIIREKSIGGIVWNTSNKNNWATSSLMNLLNGAYLNQEDGTNGSYCYFYAAFNKAHCDYREKGISDDYRSMIETRAVWKLGGISSRSNTAASFYTAERGTTVYEGNATVWPNNSGASYPIGLMYMSDFGYAVPASSCARTTNVSSYNNANCTLNNWLYSEGFEWTLTHILSSSDQVFVVYNGGYASNGYSGSSGGYGIRPVLYLKSSVWVISGDGSEANPYILGA